MRSTAIVIAGKFRSLYRAVFTTQFNHYDIDQKGSLAGVCGFCDIIKRLKEERNIWFEDEQIMVMEDIRPASKCHGLVIPKRHIRDIFNLRAT